MEFPAQDPDSPAKPLAGAARARVLARQGRSSSLKPYARPSSGLTPSGSTASFHTDAESPARHPATPHAKSLAPPPSHVQRSAFSPLRVAPSPIALLGSVRKMVSKPLAWLTSAAAAVEPDHGIPISSSTNPLSSVARKRAAALASLNSASDDTRYDRDAPTRAARAIGERLAAGLASRSILHDDEESQLRPPTSALSSSVSMSRLAPAPASARSARNLSPFDPASPVAGPSSLPRSAAATAATSADKAMTWSSRSSKRFLDAGSRSVDPNDSLELLSDAGPPSPAQPQPYYSKSYNALRSPRSQLLGYRRSLLRPDDAMSESASTSLSHSNSFSAFGYGNEVRYSDSAFGLPPSSSPFQLSSRNVATRRSRAPFTSGLFNDATTPRRSSRAGSVSLRTASPAPSAGHSPARARDATPQRRNWNALNLAAPSAPSVGDEMMREYLSSRTLPGINPTVRRSLGLPFQEPMITSSLAGDSVLDDAESLTPSRLGKRDIDMSVDGDSERLGAAGTPSKRRMVWHPNLGFISHEELKAREPKLPSPKNEAERLLNVLETMRKPTATSRGVGLTCGPPASINVPAPISDLPPSATSNTKSHEGNPAIGVAPYTRYLRKAKAVHTTQEHGGMRARLKKSQPRVNSMEIDDAATEESASKVEDSQHGNEEQHESEEEEPMPQPEPVRRSRRLQHQAPGAQHVSQTPVKHAEKPVRTTQLKSALKATPLRAAALPQAAQAIASETPKPASHRISLSAASKPSSSTLKKDNFAVRTSASDPTAPRERSSLRQGAAKTSRTHQSSGKFSAWDEDDDEEDLPDANDLAKIKLPTNMFPSGFSFGSSAPTSAPATASNPSAPDSSQDKAAVPDKAAPSSSTASGSLLGRLGGFVSSATAGEAENKEAPKMSTPASSFSFSAPSKDAPSTMPKFSFGANAAPSTVTKDECAAKKIAAPPASDFFSKPAEPASKSLSEGKKDGPVPNFFGSTMQKFETKSSGATATAPAASASSGSFSFGAPAASSSGGEAAANKPAFSFGAKPVTNSASSPSPTTSTPFGSFGAKPAETAAKKSDAAPASKPSFFGSSSSTPSTGGFSFGAPSSSTSFSGSKRGAADDDAEPAAKKSTPSFSFGAPATAAKHAEQNAVSASTGFSFGAPSGGQKKDESSAAKTGGVPNFFGAKGDDASKPSPPAASSAGFSFGKPALSGSGASSGFGASKPADTTTTPSSGFSFEAPKSATDAPKPASTGGFTFGSGGSSSSSPAPESKPAATSTSTFTFGAPKSASSDAASPATSVPASGATTPNGTFVFGGSSTADSGAAKPATSGGFSFGAPASGGTGFGVTSTSTNGGFGGFGTQAKPSGEGGGEMMDDSPQKSAPGPGAASSTPSFTFGSATPAASPAKPAGGMSFTFGTPNSGAAATSSPSTFTFGAPATSASNTGSNAGAGASTGGFRFGSPAPAPATSAPSAGFTFGASATGSTTPGVGSTPASPFLAPTNAPTTPGGSPFQFGAPTPSLGAPFQFGAASSTPSQPASSGFTFGASTSSGSSATFPQSTPTFGGAVAGAGAGVGGFGTPTTPATTQTGGFSFGSSSGLPQMPQMPQQPGLFSMGTAPSSNPNSPAGAPGGRQIKPLRQRRR